MRSTSQAGPDREGWWRRGGRWLRPAGTLVLLIGLWLAGRHFPTRPEAAWDTVHAFEVDDAQCQALLEERSTSSLGVPSEAEGSVTLAEAARKFQLELRLVCAANDLPPTCGDEVLTPGSPVLLPLSRLEATPPPSATAATAERDRDGRG